MRPRTLVLILVCQLILGCSGGTAAAKSKPARQAKKADLFLEAMGDELDRSIKKLKLENLEKPYFIEYFMWDIDSLEIEASFGALIRSDRQKYRPFRVDVRVGSYQQDNAGFVSQSTFQSLFRALGTFMLADEDYSALRHDLWLMTDDAYKQALEQLAGKRAYLQNKVQTESFDDFFRAKPVTAIADRNRPNHDSRKWQKVVRDLSAVFRDYPEIQDSQVTLVADYATRYLVNSEGSRIRQAETIVSLFVRASTQADDGMPLKHYVSFYANGLDQLPQPKEMEAAVRNMAGELTALRKAPVLETYSGPVLFSGPAAGHLLQKVLVSKLLGHRAPMIGIPQLERMASQFEENRLERRLLPKAFSVLDDPSRTSEGKLRLIGSMRYDDEGVLAEKVNLVEKGKVANLLTSRTPMKGVSKSNGHARRAVPGFNEAQISNLVVSAGKKAVPADKLEEKLLELAKEQDLDHGLIVSQLDDPDITGWEMSMSAMMSGAMRGGGEQVDAPVLVHRLGLDGKRELVRGLRFKEFALQALKDIRAAGQEPAVYHKLVGGSLGKIPMPMFTMMGGRGPKIPMAPTSILTPALLFEELELSKDDSSKKKPVVLKHPHFDQPGK